MKKIITIALAVCLVLSVMVVGVYAEETATQSRPQFSREGMPQRGRFDPNNMPQRVEFNPENMPQFDPNNMPQFDPSQMPQGEMPRFGGERTQGRPTGATKTTETTEQTENPQPTPFAEGNAENGEANGQRSSRFGEMGENRQFGGMQRPGGNMQGAQQQAEKEPMTFVGFLKAYITPIIAVVLLGLAFVFVIFYRRKNY